MSEIQNFIMNIPQLGCERKIWVYLPDGYKKTGDPYPVIYMHDGQNLFYKELTLYGDVWHADDAIAAVLKRTGKAAVVVGVENSRRRAMEYSPWETTHKEIVPGTDGYGGDGAKYAEFFAGELLAEIEKRYNVVSDRQGRAVIGSSMGGLISAYIGLKYQDKFETMGLFSPVVWFNKEEFEKFERETPQKYPQWALIYFGGREAGDNAQFSDMMLQMPVGLYKDLSARGVRCELLLRSEFLHNEAAWAHYFPKFAEDFIGRYYRQ